MRTTTPTLDEVRDVWAVDAQAWAAQGKDYSSALLQQYGIYVEMADRISGRRMLANTFFLTLNSAVFTVFGVLWETRPSSSGVWLIFPLVALLIQCASWYWILRSYRQLSSAKYTVIGALEERLPASPYWRAEWKALGRGDDHSRYLPLTHLEQWIPLLFAATYLAAFLAALFA
ncbi:MAG TPA: hypothetical protein VJ820_02520 [Propionibacteriaceae bacterium]|nr:hypothetical protein [Propionibacteriaceae bacterium]